MNKNYVIALVPARSGSKGILKKNLALLGGIPLIAHTIFAAKKSKLIDEVYVSSDDSEILKLAVNYGVNTHLRPAEFASDDASASSVVKNFLNELPIDKKRMNPLIIYLQPTSPLRSEVHIDDALLQFHSSNVNSMVSVKKANDSPYKAFTLNSDGLLESLFKEKLTNERRQNLPACYYPNGAIYIFRMSAFMAHGNFPSNGGAPFLMTIEDSVDIDTPEDMFLAEALLRKLNGEI